MNYWLIFLTGLTTGGITCAAMQGGLLASVIAGGKDRELSRGDVTTKPSTFDFLDWAPVMAFLIAKLFSHVLLGAGLGLLGSVLELSLTVKLVGQTLAALFMLFAAGNLLELHPIFRYAVIRPPKFAHRLLKNTSRSQALFAPALLGFLTIFVPCGVTQAMELLAINTGSAVMGALVMGFFVLGTFPLFAVIGIMTAKFSEYWRRSFLRIAATALVVMSLSSLNGVLTVLDSPLAFHRLGPTLVKILPPYEKSTSRAAAYPNVKVVDGVQQLTIEIANEGYLPSLVQVKKDLPVELTLVTRGGIYSCAAAFTFREFGINTFLGPTDTQTFTFTPTKKGRFTYACSMGMYRGVMEVI